MAGQQQAVIPGMSVLSTGVGSVSAMMGHLHVGGTALVLRCGGNA